MIVDICCIRESRPSPTHLRTTYTNQKKKTQPKTDKKTKETTIVVTKVVTEIVYRDTALTSSLTTHLEKDGTKVFLVKWVKDTAFTSDDAINIAGNTYIKVDSNLNAGFYKSSFDCFSKPLGL